MVRILLFLVVVLVACRPAAGPTGTVIVHVSPAARSTWLLACGRRVGVPRDAWPIVLTLAAGRPCTLTAERDDRGAVVRTPPEVLTLAPGERQVRVLSLPEPGSVGTPGFTLVPGPRGARVLPLDHTPRDPGAPHPSWLEGSHVVAVDGASLQGASALTLDALAHGAPGSRLRLLVEVPAPHEVAPAHFPLMTQRGARYLVPFVRQRPVAWQEGRPPAATVAAWVSDRDLPPDEVAERMERWRAGEVRTSRSDGRTPASIQPPPP
ncbi:MAG: hypothetical protein H6732_03710 [Alphaproteobacteria bacterium]|nr:hypothetical protein [Alphaproteobacteria bacterium]